MTIVKVEVQEKFKQWFSDKQDHNSIGILFDENSDHISIKPFKRDLNSSCFIGSITRYPKRMLKSCSVVELIVKGIGSILPLKIDAAIEMPDGEVIPLGKDKRHYIEPVFASSIRQSQNKLENLRVNGTFYKCDKCGFLISKKEWNTKNPEYCDCLLYGFPDYQKIEVKDKE